MKLVVLKNQVPINEIQVETPDLTERYEIYVGRSEDCHVLIDDPLISRHHFVIKNIGGKWFSEKLSQLGFVSVSGNTAAKIEVQNGDEIKFGSYSIFLSDLPVFRIQNNSEDNSGVHQAVIEKAEPLENPESLEAMEALSDSEVLEMDGVEEAHQAAPIVAQSLDDVAVDLSPDAGVEVEAATDSPSQISESFEEEKSVTKAPEQEAFNATGASDLAVDFNTNTQAESAAIAPSTNEVTETPEDSTRFFKAFVNYQLVLFGERAPYDRYQIDQAEIFIGREPKKCQIILNDPEVSTVHAVIRKNNIDIILEDLNSSNGTILNGERINKAHLTTGDEFVIGSTSFTLETRSDLLDAEAGRLMPVESGQTIEKEEIEEEIVSGQDNTDANFSTEGIQEKSIIKGVWNNPQKRKKLIYAVAGVALAYVFLAPDEPIVTAPKTENPVAKEGEPVKKEAITDTPKVTLTKELEDRRNMSYELGIDYFEQNKYFEALKEFQIVTSIDPGYKKVSTYLEQTNVGLKRLEELETQKRSDEEKIKMKKVIEDLLVKAREAVKDKQATVAESYFSQIAEKDPENIEVQQLKMELEAWQKEQEKVALERASKESARKSMIDSLSMGKTFYLKKEWYRAILKLEEYLRRKGLDEDLVKEASDMLSDAKTQLASELGPLIGKARSLKEGQDLRNAYEAFLDVLKVEPTNSEALNEVDEIKAQLETRSKRIYREAIIAESLSLFVDAKEKFQEVQQISPSDSEYYKKASDKLKNYLE